MEYFLPKTYNVLVLPAFFVDEWVVVALDFEDSTVSFAFFFCDRVHFVTGFKKFAVLFRQINPISLFHVETDSCNNASRFLSRLGFFLLEVDDGLALAVHGFGIVGPLAVHEVVAVPIHFADGRVEVMKVPFHDLECGIVGAAVLAAPIFPAGEKVAHVVGGHDVFPFDGVGAFQAFAVGVVAGLEIAGGKVYGFLV